MRLWSIDPEYLDSKGLVALWREGLLAKKVLEGKTRGYINHPQLFRFKNSKDPFFAINSYLFEIQKEALRRGYNFNIKKIKAFKAREVIKITSGQIEFEFKHLLYKLKKRDKSKFDEIKNIKKIKINKVFKKISGDVEEWEKI